MKKVGKVITYLILAAFLTVNHPGFSINTDNPEKFEIEWNEPALIAIPDGGGIKNVMSFERSVHIAEYSYLPMFPIKIPDKDVLDIQIIPVQTLDLSPTELDIIEIDGASNRRIEEIRTLRESVKYAPTRGNYKVYIINVYFHRNDPLKNVSRIINAYYIFVK